MGREWWLIVTISVWRGESIWVLTYWYGKKGMVKCNHNDNHQLPHPCQRPQEQWCRWEGWAWPPSPASWTGKCQPPFGQYCSFRVLSYSPARLEVRDITPATSIMGLVTVNYTSILPLTKWTRMAIKSDIFPKILTELAVAYLTIIVLLWVTAPRIARY